MRIITARRISQIFFFLLFLWFCIVSTLGEQWWQLRGWPVGWLIQLDPLVGLGTLLATGTIYAGLLWGLLTVVLTILLGRFFCGWLCPFGTLHQAVGWLANLGRRASWRIAANRYRRSQGVKYTLLLFLLGATTGTLISRLLNVPIQSPYLAAAIVVALLLLGVGALRLRTISGVRWVFKQFIDHGFPIGWPIPEIVFKIGGIKAAVANQLLVGQNREGMIQVRVDHLQKIEFADRIGGYMVDARCFRIVADHHFDDATQFNCREA